MRRRSHAAPCWPGINLPSYLTKARPRLGATARKLCDEDGRNWEDLDVDERGEYEDRAWEVVARWDRRRRERDGK